MHHSSHSLSGSLKDIETRDMYKTLMEPLAAGRFSLHAMRLPPSQTRHPYIKSQVVKHGHMVIRASRGAYIPKIAQVKADEPSP